MIWGYYVSPMSYGQNAIVLVEFLDKRWSAVRSPKNMQMMSVLLYRMLLVYLDIFPTLPLQPYLLPFNKSTTVGKILLKSRGMYTEEYWYWICVAALLGFSLLFNLCFIAALTYLNRKMLNSY